MKLKTLIISSILLVATTVANSDDQQAFRIINNTKDLIKVSYCMSEGDVISDDSLCILPEAKKEIRVLKTPSSLALLMHKIDQKSLVTEHSSLHTLGYNIVKLKPVVLDALFEPSVKSQKTLTIEKVKENGEENDNGFCYKVTFDSTFSQCHNFVTCSETKDAQVDEEALRYNGQGFKIKLKLEPEETKKLIDL